MSITVMKQALEALEHEAEIGNDDAYKKERDALRQAIAEAKEQEPAVFLKDWSDWRDMVVANIMRHGNIDKHLARDLANHFQNMTPQRQWVELTPEEIVAEAKKEEQAHGFVQGAIWAEAKLKEKNCE